MHMDTRAAAACEACSRGAARALREGSVAATGPAAGTGIAHVVTTYTVMAGRWYRHRPYSYDLYSYGWPLVPASRGGSAGGRGCRVAEAPTVGIHALRSTAAAPPSAAADGPSADLFLTTFGARRRRTPIGSRRKGLGEARL